MKCPNCKNNIKYIEKEEVKTSLIYIKDFKEESTGYHENYICPECSYYLDEGDVYKVN